MRMRKASLIHATFLHAVRVRAAKPPGRLIFFRWEEPVAGVLETHLLPRNLPGLAPLHMRSHQHEPERAPKGGPEVAPALWVFFAEVGGRGGVNCDSTVNLRKSLTVRQ